MVRESSAEGIGTSLGPVGPRLWRVTCSVWFRFGSNCGSEGVVVTRISSTKLGDHHGASSENFHVALRLEPGGVIWLSELAELIEPGVASDDFTVTLK